jgi:DNA-binding NtrC family response regulator
MSQWDKLVKTVTMARPSALRVPRARIEVLGGADRGQSFELDLSARIGSRKVADVVLNDPRVSGLHFELTAADGLRVRDLGSKNGTYIGSIRVLEAIVPPGETVTVGETRLRITALEAGPALALYEGDSFFGLVGNSVALRSLIVQIQKAARADVTVLIQGETGTGKERVAEALHLAGPRAAGPLVIVDCGSLPAGLIEDELLGHEKGAFTGASSAVAGAFERAHGGTLFLDEIGELPLELQPKLLRALESRLVRRLGGSQAIAVDVRVIAATNRDLALEVARGRLREDLFYRLAVVTLVVPPLRQHSEDIPLLAAHFLTASGADPASYLTEGSLKELLGHSWPGNVRELRNTIERAVTLAQPARVEAEGLRVPPSAGEVDLKIGLREGKQRLVEHYERAYLTAMLEACRGNMAEAARRSGMDRISIYRMMRRLGFGDAPGEPKA